MINEISIKIRNLRKERNLTLKDLSEKTGLSVSFLSQVENNTSSLAITSLKKIADALNVSINYFFYKPKIHNFLIKSENQSVFQIESSNSQFIRLSGDFSNRVLESMLVVIPPEQQHGHKFSHPGEEFIYVLEGAIIVNLDDTEYLVKAGDSFHFPSTIPHIWINPLKQPAKILSVVTPVIF
ncbi:helix-turn-helix domain-containing protein [Tepidibacter formicigenes]|jgi:transcriptional regulator with XRE-family HTH domain|uniref:Transcriptional regulator, XRE family with cupin sensor n=1 Tax=Tepidibacter formicigenes DSM 15518 TaxID=1123349 RepID=A0A1M6R842_9FIRM|nr:cupin domain-containing protein [Tepidibacter formicigenes]SHK28645.1 transcriptional regulator, XRE family with cupin sensor [Tepidibacter formicigenes DSM 15518]